MSKQTTDPDMKYTGSNQSSIMKTWRETPHKRCTHEHTVEHVILPGSLLFARVTNGLASSVTPHDRRRSSSQSATNYYKVTDLYDEHSQK